MKRKIDMDGNVQTDFFSAATIDVINMPTKQKLVVRFNEVLRLVECGDADYGRLKGEEDKWKAIASLKHYNWGFYAGERVSVKEAKGIVKFLESWVARRGYYHDELKSLQRSIDLYDYKVQKGECE